jgi:hypothetical protein
MDGDLFGNPGVDTSQHRMGLDGIGPVPEQPGWFWAGPAGGLGTDSQSEGRRFESDLGLHSLIEHKIIPAIGDLRLSRVDTATIDRFLAQLSERGTRCIRPTACVGCP